MLFGIGSKLWAAIAGGIVLTSAVIAGVAVADGETFDPVHAPAWQSGYSFSYDITADITSVIEDGIEGFGLPDSSNFSIGPIPVKKEILSTEYRDADGQPVYLSAATFPFSSFQAGAPVLSGLGQQPAYANAERMSDLAPIPVTHDMDCAVNDCAGGGINFFAGNDMTYLQFPLTNGKYWEQEVDLDFPIDIEYLEGINRMHVIGEVGGMETIDLVMGPTEAVRVDISYTPIGLQDKLSEVATMLEQAGFELDRFNIQLGMHEIIHYSPEYEAIVQQKYIIRGLVDVALQGNFQGYEIDESVYAEANVLLTSVLTGADRVAGPQQTPLEILNKLTNADLIADARGKVVQQVPYTISMSTNEPEVNAAESPLVGFEVAMAGVESLPAGHNLRFSVADADGWIVHEGKAGSQFGYEFSEPGAYRVTATAADENGNPVSAASTTVIANYEAEVDADCGLSIVAGMDCAPFEFIVAPGIQSVTVGAYEDLNSPPIESEVTVREPDGDITTHPANQPILFQGAGISSQTGEWDLRYQNYGSPLGDVTYVISAQYAFAAPSSVAASEPEAGPGGLMSDMLAAIDAMLAFR